MKIKRLAYIVGAPVLVVVLYITNNRRFRANLMLYSNPIQVRITKPSRRSMEH